MCALKQTLRRELLSAAVAWPSSATCRLCTQRAQFFRGGLGRSCVHARVARWHGLRFATRHARAGPGNRNWERACGCDGSTVSGANGYAAARAGGGRRSRALGLHGQDSRRDVRQTETSALSAYGSRCNRRSESGAVRILVAGRTLQPLGVCSPPLFTGRLRRRQARRRRVHLAHRVLGFGALVRSGRAPVAHSGLVRERPQPARWRHSQSHQPGLGLGCRCRARGGKRAEPRANALRLRRRHDCDAGRHRFQFVQAFAGASRGVRPNEGAVRGERATARMVSPRQPRRRRDLPHRWRQRRADTLSCGRARRRRGELRTGSARIKRLDVADGHRQRP